MTSVPSFEPFGDHVSSTICLGNKRGLKCEKFRQGEESMLAVRGRHWGAAEMLSWHAGVRK